MKSIERHKLKENEFARTVAQAREVLDARKRTLTIALIVARRGPSRPSAATCGGGRPATRRERAARLGARRLRRAGRADRRARARAAPRRCRRPERSPPSRRSSRPRCRSSARRPTATRTPRRAWSRSYHLAGILAALGHYPEAEQRYPGSRQQGRPQHLRPHRAPGAGRRAGRAGQVRHRDHDLHGAEPRHESQIPVDSVLMQLGRAYARAGRKEEAARTFDRIVQEFPQSLYAARRAARARGGAEVLTFGGLPHALAARSGVGTPSRGRNKSVVYFPAASVCSAV